MPFSSITNVRNWLLSVRCTTREKSTKSISKTINQVVWVPRFGLRLESTKRRHRLGFITCRDSDRRPHIHLSKYLESTWFCPFQMAATGFFKTKTGLQSTQTAMVLKSQFIRSDKWKNSIGDNWRRLSTNQKANQIQRSKNTRMRDMATCKSRKRLNLTKISTKRVKKTLAV